MEILKAMFILIISSMNVYGYELHGHLTGAMYKSLEVDSTEFDNQADFERLSKAGITLVHNLDDQFSLKFGSVVKSSNSFKPAVDVAKLVFSPNSWFDLSLGRMKLPIWMHSEYKDVGHLFPWLNLPNEVYAQNPINSFDGMQIGFHLRPYTLFGFDLALYAGSTNDINKVRGKNYVSRTTISEQTEIYFKFKNIYGAQAQIVTDQLTLSASYLQGQDQSFLYTDIHSNLGAGVQLLRLRTDMNLGTGKFFNLGAKYKWQDLTLMSEFIMTKTDGDFYRDYQGYYVMSGYTFNEKIMPHLTYAKNTKVSSTAFGGNTDSLTAGINYFHRDSVTWKLEYVYSRYLSRNATRESINPDDNVKIVAAGVEVVF